MVNRKVIKRSGNEVEFDIEKIKKVIKCACDKLEINPEKLESNLQMNFKERMTSIEIQNYIILSALRLTTIEEPEWSIVAARLRVMAMYKEAQSTRDYKSFGYDSYSRFLAQAVKNNFYDKVIYDLYSPEEIKDAGKFINPDYDLAFDYAGMNALDTKYLIKKDKKVFELPQEAFLTMALLIEQNQNKKIRLKKVFDTYTKLAQRKLSLATPILLNLRKPNGNLSSCFITAMDDDLKSIYYVLEQAAFISQNGGGVGVNLSRVRSKNAPIKGVYGAGGGIVNWIKLLNDTATGVNQLGKRPGAITTSLDIWHRDIEQLLELQTENGDPRTKAFDIFPQVIIVDEFMKRVQEDSDWFLIDPYEVKELYGVDLVELHGAKFEKIYAKIEKDIRNVFESQELSFPRLYNSDFESKYRNALETLKTKKNSLQLVSRIKAKDLLKHIMKTCVETGMPYIAFKDTINKYNPNKDLGTILGGNLCMESFSNTSPSKIVDYKMEDGTITRKVIAGDLHTCNLASVNLAFANDDELEEVCATGVRVLDNLIDLTTTPVMEGMLHNKKYRTIGLGFMGYADYCAKKEVAYTKSQSLANELFERLALYSTRQSVELSKERGAFEAFEHSEYKKGIILGKDKKWFKENSSLANDWIELIEEIAKHGIRNSQITAIAPNTSTSQLQGCSASVLPVYGKFFMDSGKATVPITPPFIKTHNWFYQENKNIDQRKVIEVISQIQKWIDTGISMELLLNPNLEYVNAKYFYDLIMLAWKSECKTIYYVRSIQKGEDSAKSSEGCSSCSG